MIAKVSSAFLFLFLSTQTLGAPTFSQIEELTGQIEETIGSDGSTGISEAERALAEQLKAYGDPVIPSLIAFLKHEKRDVRDFAAYTLGRFDALEAEHLDDLIDAHESGVSWILNVIGRVENSKATTYLLRQLFLPRPYEQGIDFVQAEYPFRSFKDGWMDGVFGEHMIPALSDLFRCVNCDPYMIRNALSIWAGLGPEAKGAVVDLLEIARNEKYDFRARAGAILALGEIGAASHKVAADLVDLKNSGPPTFALAVDRALVQMKHPDAVPILLAWMDWEPDKVLRDIAAMGRFGSAAGVEIIKYLNHDLKDRRVAAATTLGLIEYERAVTPLIEVLGSEGDWRLVYAAVEALGRIGPDLAIEPLERVATSHWYPAVRYAANVALGRDTYSEAHLHRQRFLSPFYSYLSLGHRPCETTDLNFIKEGPEKLFGKGDQKALDDLKAEIDHEDVLGLVRRVTWVPNVAMRVQGGWLAGVNRGEWGGTLFYKGDDGATVNIGGRNIQNIFRLDGDIFAVAGLGHLGLNWGEVYKVRPADGDGWVIMPWKTLPGNPLSSGLVEGGRMLINSSGGSVVVSPQGRIEMASCG